MEVQRMKVPDKYEPKNADEFGTFYRAMSKILAVPIVDNIRCPMTDIEMMLDASLFKILLSQGK